MKRLCTICARGGSKGVKGKNLRHLLGKPLIAHSIIQARESEMFDAIAVSSDSEDILKIAKEWGADHMVIRPPEWATDTAPKVPAIRHCMKEVESRMGITFDTVMDLDATAPLRIIEDIRNSINLLEQSGAENIGSGMPSRRSPYFNLVEMDDLGRIHLSKKPEKPIVRRQDSPQCFDLNASVFAWTRRGLINNDVAIGLDTIFYEMPEERSIDIDNELDFLFVEFVMTRKTQND